MTDTLSPVSPDPQEVPGRVPRLRSMRVTPFVIFVLAAVFFLYQIVAGGITLLLAGGTITVDTVQWVRWSTLIGQLLFILVPTLVFTRLRYGTILRPLRFRLPTVPQVLAVLIGVFALQQVLQGYMALQDAIPLPPGIQRWVDMIKDMFEATYRILVSAKTLPELLLVIFTVAVVPPFRKRPCSGDSSSVISNLPPPGRGAPSSRGASSHSIT